jgi:hypothetical protein
LFPNAPNRGGVWVIRRLFFPYRSNPDSESQESDPDRNKKEKRVDRRVGIKPAISKGKKKTNRFVA